MTNSELDSVLPDYIRVSQAPSLQEIIEGAKLAGEDPRVALNREWKARYKAIKGRDVYLVQNPAMMEAQLEFWPKRNTVKRIKPQYMLTLGKGQGSTTRRAGLFTKSEGDIEW